MSFDNKDPIFKEWLIDVLKAEDCTITFIKTDGTERVMKCTLRPEAIVEYVKKTERGRKPNEEAVSVWDLENNGWRSIRFESIRAIEFPLGKTRMVENV